MNSFEFGKELARSRVMPHISRHDKSGLSSVILNKILLFTGNNYSRNATVHNELGNNRKRCWLSLSEIAGRDHKAKKDSLIKTFTRCQRCQESIFLKSLTLIKVCSDCFKKIDRFSATFEANDDICRMYQNKNFFFINFCWNLAMLLLDFVLASVRLHYQKYFLLAIFTVFFFSGTF